MCHYIYTNSTITLTQNQIWVGYNTKVKRLMQIKQQARQENSAAQWNTKSAKYTTHATSMQTNCDLSKTVWISNKLAS